MSRTPPRTPHPIHDQHNSSTSTDSTQSRRQPQSDHGGLFSTSNGQTNLSLFMGWPYSWYVVFKHLNCLRFPLKILPSSLSLVFLFLDCARRPLFLKLKNVFCGSCSPVSAMLFMSEPGRKRTCTWRVLGKHKRSNDYVLDSR